MPLNLYKYYTGPHLVGDNYQSEIPSVAYQRLRSQVNTGKIDRSYNSEHMQAIRRYKKTIMKDPDIAAEFAFMFQDHHQPLYPNEEKFVADNATNLKNLIDYMHKFGVNDAMRNRIERDGTISDRMVYAQRIQRVPLGPEFTEQILTAPVINIALYTADFEGEKNKGLALPAGFIARARERILTDEQSVGIYMGLAQRHWPAGEEMLLRSYANSKEPAHILTWVVQRLAETDADAANDLANRMQAIDNERAQNS